MASEVEICNLALGHLGDRATVASIDPPEGSAQAEHCARFYPIARDTLLEMHNWSFATRRITGAQVTSPSPAWEFAYAKPNNSLRVLAVLHPEATDDYAVGYRFDGEQHLPSAAGLYTPQPFAMETLADGSEVILTNQEDAVIRYTARITDTTKFSPLFVITLSWHLSSMLAGPVLKGDVGAAESKRCVQVTMSMLNQAKASDANQRDIKPQHLVTWMAGR